MSSSRPFRLRSTPKPSGQVAPLARGSLSPAGQQRVDAVKASATPLGGRGVGGAPPLAKPTAPTPKATPADPIKHAKAPAARVPPARTAPKKATPVRQRREGRETHAYWSAYQHDPAFADPCPGCGGGSFEQLDYTNVMFGVLINKRCAACGVVWLLKVAEDPD
jgi:hypothetical protein